MIRRRQRNEQGFFTVWVLGLCVAMFFVAGISVDGWRIFTERRATQAMADSAAVAGTSAVDTAYYADHGKAILLPDQAVAAACHYLETQQPLPCTDGHFAINLIYDPVNTTQAVGVSVRIRKNVPFTLLKILPDEDGSFHSGFEFNTTGSAKAQCIRPDGTACN